MSTGFLITNLSGKLKPLNDMINKYVQKKLYIYVLVNSLHKNILNYDWVSKRIVDLYSSSFYLFPHIDVRIILNEVKQKEKILQIKDYDLDVVLLPKNFNEEKLINLKSNEKKLPIIYFEESLYDEKKIDSLQFKSYKNVILGGTFDRLHAGHKILISEALLRCSVKLTVGVTDTEMIKGKKLWELIEPCKNRIEAVEKFIREVDNTINYEVIPISDIYGPTKYDSNLDLIVVSSETIKGAQKINDLRKKNELCELKVHVVELAENSNKGLDEEEKISSSNIRMRLLGTHLKPPKPKPNLPAKPYIIGLTGGVASGKSHICKYLTELGAAVVDCDKVGHQLYKPGTEIYDELKKIFGDQILSANKEINRKKLGDIVFKDSKKLETLNNLMWPAIFKASIEECQKFYNKDKKEIVVLEAAVLLKAGWHENVHEIWATIIPEEEAINRLMKRNNLTENEARLRVEAQPTNIEVVEKANVIFCSLWSYEFTNQQVIKAWDEIKIGV